MKVNCPRCKAELEYVPRSVQTCSHCNAKVKMPEPDRLPEKLRNRWRGIVDEAKAASEEPRKESSNSDKQPDFADAMLDVLNAENEKDRQAQIAEEKRREKEAAAMRADEEALEAELLAATRDVEAREQAVEPLDVELLDLPSPEQTEAEGDPGHIQSRLRACPDCGKSVSKRAKQCPECGCPLVAATIVGQSVNEPWKNPVVLAGVCAALLAVIGLGLAFNSGESADERSGDAQRPSNAASTAQSRSPDAFADGSSINTTTSPIADTREIETTDPVEELKSFAEALLAEAQRLLKGRKFHIRSAALGTVAYECEISNDYTIDCKRSDSIISPIVGTIVLQRRAVYDEIHVAGQTLSQMPDKWQPLSIECGYHDGKWKLNKSLEQSLNP